MFYHIPSVLSTAIPHPQFQLGMAVTCAKPPSSAVSPKTSPRSPPLVGVNLKVPNGTQSPGLSDSEPNPDLLGVLERVYNERQISLSDERAFAEIVGDLEGRRKGQLEERACQSAGMLLGPTPGSSGRYEDTCLPQLEVCQRVSSLLCYIQMPITQAQNLLPQFRQPSNSPATQQARADS